MRIRNLRIENFRGFCLFRMKGLGRINLIVGAKDSGKTTVLEAIDILMSGGDASVIWTTLYRRGETAWVERPGARGRGSTEFEIKRLFRDRNLGDLAFFRISADTDRGEVAATARVERFRPAAEQGPRGPAMSPEESAGSGEAPRPMMLRLAWSPGPAREAVFPIDGRGSVSAPTILRTAGREGPEGVPHRFLAAPPSSAEVPTALFERIVEAPGHELVIDWLRLVEPAIERISSGRMAGVSSVPMYGSRGGVVFRRAGDEDWTAIEALGATARRLFALAVNLASAANGILLVDEIDAGIPRALMDHLWDRIVSAASRYDVQVFATAGRPDGAEGLVSISRRGDPDEGEIAILRVEPGREEAVEDRRRAPTPTGTPP